LEEVGHSCPTRGPILNGTSPEVPSPTGFWQDWPGSSAAGCLEAMGRKNAKSIWKGYPVFDDGKGWDDPAL
jgi:hypothetical protein